MIQEKDWKKVQELNEDMERGFLEAFYLEFFEYDRRLIDLWALIQEEDFRQWYSFEIINSFTSLKEYSEALKNYWKGNMKE